jgi:signal transduction histidine kinase
VFYLWLIVVIDNHQQAMNWLGKHRALKRASRTGRRSCLLSALSGLCWIVVFITASGANGAEGGRVTRVLLLHSFGREFPPFSVFSEQFRTDLARQSPVVVDFYDVSLDSARFDQPPQDGPLVDYLLTLFAGRRLDLVVPIGGPAVSFAQRYRRRLFPSVPMLIASVDQRRVQAADLTANDAVIPVRLDPAAVIENILQVLPSTRNVVVVFGNSPVEKFWVGEFARELKPLANRVNLVWFNQLSFARIQERAAALPPGSAIFYAELSVDADGVPHEEERALADLHAVANAPIFGLFDYQLGRGIVGGPLLSVREQSQKTAAVAARILKGEAPATMRTPPMEPGRPIYDWRELKRWGINENRLPSGSTVQFRQPTIWQEYKWHIAAVVVLCFGQAALISGLLIQRRRRRRADREIENLAGRLITAQEAERSRIARDLHDDINQQLASLSIALSSLRRRLQQGETAGVQEEVARLQQRIIEVTNVTRQLSHDLHPGVLQHAGLVAALRGHCAEVGAQHGINVTFSAADGLDGVPQDVGLCLYRVAQEALRNITAHSGAREARVALSPTAEGLELIVNDDGQGFDLAEARRRGGVGLISLDERVRLIGGSLRIETRPQRGTELRVLVPIRGAR